ncbi:hypothetical protein SESBI_35789 [Sesbania bispinosa]|nr:hypothetical protein SESBI_35789 [Sesbania bispinosa]
METTTKVVSLTCLKVLQLFKIESDLWTSFRKHLVLAAVAIVAEVEAEAANEAEVATCDDELLGGEMRQSFGLISLSSSVIVSNIFDVLCLITVTYCGGATSMKNLAMREFAIDLNLKCLRRRDI